MTNRERRIREIAYHLWEQEGRPEGESHSHRLWLAAEAQFEAENTEREDAGNAPAAEAFVEPPAEPAVKVAAEPVVKAAEPAVKAAEPVVKAAEPVVKAAEPVVKAAEPAVKAAEPAVERPAHPTRRKTVEPAEKPARSTWSKAAEPPPEKKTGSARPKTEEFRGRQAGRLRQAEAGREIAEGRHGAAGRRPRPKSARSTARFARAHELDAGSWTGSTLAGTTKMREVPPGPGIPGSIRGGETPCSSASQFWQAPCSRVWSFLHSQPKQPSLTPPRT